LLCGGKRIGQKERASTSGFGRKGSECGRESAVSFSGAGAISG